MRNSNRNVAVTKPNGSQVADRFPLYLHKTGQYAKKVRGRVHYFGKDREKALSRYMSERDALQAGLVVRPEPTPAQVTLKTGCETLLAQKQSLVTTGELSSRTLADYRSASKRLLAHFGPHRLLTDLRPVDFIPFREKCSENRSAVTTGNTLRFVRSILRFFYDQDLIDRPIKFGKALALPSQAVVRAERHKRGPLMFSAAEIRLMLNGTTATNGDSDTVTLAGASPVLKAMILLAINCGFGQTDCSRLLLRHIDLENGWHTFPRPKTSIERRCKLWPESVEALRAYLKTRRTPSDKRLSDRVFLTRFGDEFVKVKQTASESGDLRITPIDAVSLTFCKLLKRLSIKRHRVSFYSLRRTFRTIADETRDQPAIDHIMGHSPQANDMAARYRQSISDERLKAVSDYVRNWLFNCQ